MSFETGDVVQLKSGGPAMTVERTETIGMAGDEGVGCVWFEQVGNMQVVQRNTFPPAVLEKSGRPGIASISVTR